MTTRLGPEDPIVTVAAARLAELEAEESGDSAAIAGVEARRREREGRRQRLEEQLAEAESRAEADRLRAELPAVAAELQAVGAEVRGAFDAIAGKLPALLSAQARYEHLVARADVLRLAGVRVEGVTVGRRSVPALGGIGREVLAIVKHAILAQRSAESRR